MKRVMPHSKLIAAVMLSGVLASIGLIGGLGLQLVRRDILSFLPLLIALPALNAMAGEYATLTASHLADPENYKQRTQKLALALFVSLPISAAGVCAVTIGAARFRGFVISGDVMWDYISLVFILLYSVTFLMFLLIYVANKLLIAMEVNVDDTLIPIANTIASVLMLSGLAVLVRQFV